MAVKFMGNKVVEKSISVTKFNISPNNTKKPTTSLLYAKEGACLYYTFHTMNCM